MKPSFFIRSFHCCTLRQEAYCGKSLKIKEVVVIAMTVYFVRQYEHVADFSLVVCQSEAALAKNGQK